VAHFRLELAEKGRSGFEKINLRNFIDPAGYVVEKMTGKEGGRLQLRFMRIGDKLSKTINRTKENSKERRVLS
jgi:hypothetical protein